MNLGKLISKANVTALGLCVLLLAFYAIAAWSAVARESPTVDEPYHAISAWVQLHRHDFRIDHEDPPLWQYWASLPNGRYALRAEFDGPLWREMPVNLSNQWTWTVDTLYRTPGNDGARFVARCRAMMLVLAVALGALIAACAWRLGGPVAAVTAAAAFALDPNFLAHGPLMKNDVVASLTWLALAASLWDVGRRATVASVVRLIVLTALPISVKYSGLLAGALVPVALIGRAIMAEPWPVFGRTLASRRGRLVTAAGITVAAGLFTFVAIWGIYGFRFRSGPDPADRLDVTQLADRAFDNERKVHPDQTGPGLSVRATMFADEHRLLPEPFLGGFLFTYGQSLIRPTFLLGESSLMGWWYYFPAVMLMKTPVATLVGVAAVAWLAVGARRRSTPAGRWVAFVLVAPVGVYMASAMSTNLNIGLRHVLPVYPPIFIALGWATATAVQRWGQAARVTVAVLLVGLVAELAIAWPHPIPFTNAVALGLVGGDRRRLFSDSNLDWGQDLPLLAEWRKGHPDGPLYLSYFGLADPRTFGIEYVGMPGGYRYDADVRFPDPMQSNWVAVSATLLQAPPYLADRLRPYYQHLAGLTPVAVLGDSIYVYRVTPKDQLRTR